MLNFSLYDGQMTLIRIIVAWVLANMGNELFLNYFELNGYNELVGEGVLIFLFVIMIRLFIYPNNLHYNKVIKNTSQAMFYLSWKKVLFFIFFVFFFRLGVFILTAIYMKLTAPDILLNEIEKILQLQESFSERVLKIKNINTIFLAPIVEEIFYRGFILSYLLSRYRVSTAIIIASIIFAFFHGHFLSPFLGGIFFSIVYVLFRNIFLCVLLHSLTNFLVIAFDPKLLFHIVLTSLERIFDPYSLLLVFFPALIIFMFLFLMPFFLQQKQKNIFSNDILAIKSNGL
jgi:membrane protease YdiL (CAAX protease family)